MSRSSNAAAAHAPSLVQVLTEHHPGARRIRKSLTCLPLLSESPSGFFLPVTISAMCHGDVRCGCGLEICSWIGCGSAGRRRGSSKGVRGWMRVDTSKVTGYSHRNVTSVTNGAGRGRTQQTVDVICRRTNWEPARKGVRRPTVFGAGDALLHRSKCWAW